MQEQGTRREMTWKASEQETTIATQRKNYSLSEENIWVATWQNQQSECAPSEDSDQRLRCALNG